MLTGAGQIHFTTNDLATNSLRGENLLFKGCVASFTLTPEETEQTAVCLEDGITQISDAAITKVSNMLELTFQSIGWQTMQFAYDEIAQEYTNIVLPVVKSATIPASGTITDTDITAANEDEVLVSSKNTFFSAVDGAPASVTEVQIDGTNNNLVFDTSLEGTVVCYRVPKTYATIDAIGVAGPYDKFGALQFSGILAGTRFPVGAQLVCPRIQRVKTPTLTISENLTELAITYRVVLAPGQRRAYQIYNLDTATV